MNLCWTQGESRNKASYQQNVLDFHIYVRRVIFLPLQKDDDSTLRMRLLVLMEKPKKKNHWGNKQTNKQKDWQEATGIVYYVLFGKVRQACPLSKGFLPLLVLGLPADTALPRRVLLSLGANRFLSLRFLFMLDFYDVLPSDRSIVLPIKVSYGSQEVGRTCCPHGSPCPRWGITMSNIAVVLWLPGGDYLNSCRLLGKAILKTHLPPSDQKYSELAAHSQCGVCMGLWANWKFPRPWQGVWMRWSWRSLPTQTILWFCLG